MFKVGERVKTKYLIAGATELPAGSFGVVKDYKSSDSMLVEFAGWRGGHSNDGGPGTGSQWWMSGDALIAAPFNVGDRVKITKIDPGVPYSIGDVGFLTVDHGGIGFRDHLFTIAIGGIVHGVYAYQIEAAPALALTPKIEIGDEVEVVDIETIPFYDRPKMLTNGTKGKVFEAGGLSGRVGVKFDGWLFGHNAAAGLIGSRNCWFFYLKNLKKVEKAATPAIAAPAPKPDAGTFIVVSDEGPSSKPYVHTTRGGAETEAQRLALKLPGLGFTVFQAVTRIEVEKPQVTKQYLDKLAA